MKQNNKSNRVKRIDLNNPGALTYTKPIKYTYYGEAFLVDSWRELYVDICRRLISNNTEIFEAMKKSGESRRKKPWIVGTDSLGRLNYPEMIVDGFYIETQKSSDDIIRSLRFILDKCMISFDKVGIYYLERGSVSDTEVKTVNFNLMQDLKNTKPYELTYFGNRIVEKSWRTLYKDICEKLLEDYSDNLEKYRNRCILSSGKPMIADEANASVYRQPTEIGSGFYIEMNRDANNILKCIKELIDECNVDYDDISITYLEKWNILEVDEDAIRKIAADDNLPEENNTTSRPFNLRNDSSQIEMEGEAMSTWMISANSSIYDHAGSFRERGYIDWRQYRNYKPGDVVYIYFSKPVKKLGFKTLVEKVELEADEITNDKAFWKDLNEYYVGLKHNRYVRLRLLEEIDVAELDLYHMLEHGLTAAPQGGARINDELIEYIESFLISDDDYLPLYPETVVPDDAIEGAKQQIVVNKYERNAEARRRCIEYHGCRCLVCGMSFEEKYGEIGKGFIHVHHIIPLSEIGEEYKVNYRTDLIPVCPNCHAMIHRSGEGSYEDVIKIKNILKTNHKEK